MTSIFISSLARGEMGAIRQAARQAVESLDMKAVTFESAPAADEASRRVLLDALERCDALVLLLGREYGEPVARGVSPTEEEFDHARANRIPVLALVQAGDREPAQDAFVARVRGGWETGAFAPEFTGPADIGFAVVKTLNAWRNVGPAAALAAAASDRAMVLAKGDERPNTMSSGSKLRVVAAPALTRPLLDALALEDARLPDDLATLARTCGLVTNAMAVTTRSDADAIHLDAKAARDWEQPHFLVGLDGAVVAEGAVGATQGHFAGSYVMADRARAVMEAVGRFTLAVWERIDAPDEVRQAAVAVAVPEAHSKIYALEQPGNTLSSPQGLPHVLVVPDPPLVVRREDVVAVATLDRLQAELKRQFALARGVYPA